MKCSIGVSNTSCNRVLVLALLTILMLTNTLYAQNRPAYVFAGKDPGDRIGYKVGQEVPALQTVNSFMANADLQPTLFAVPDSAYASAIPTNIA